MPAIHPSSPTLTRPLMIPESDTDQKDHSLLPPTSEIESDFGRSHILSACIHLIGIGPGDPRQMTLAAREALAEAEVIIGYRPYLELIATLIGAREIIASGMTEELARCRAALDLARQGRRVALISSGDVGLFGMAGPLFELLFAEGWQPGGDPQVRVFPGITAATACAARLGAPLNHDFCAISLSDQLTPWETIAARLRAAAQADFVIALYNPRSRRRHEQLLWAQDILLRYRPAETPVAIVTCAYRDRERVELRTLADLAEAEIGMLSTLMIGNRSTQVRGGWMFTPRGYGRKYHLSDGRARDGETPGRSLSRQQPITARADAEGAHSCPALFVAATSSGQGKTTLVAALARLHRRAGRRVRVFKIGPDFLDPLILARASGTEVEPLDLWMVGEAACQRALYEAAAPSSTGADVILIEGAMGLFDGDPSGADLAERLGLPVAVLIDARGMGQTFGALALGLVRYRPGVRIAGVIANRVGSARHAEMIRAGLPAEAPWLGAMPRFDDAALPSRHLGLVQAEEIDDLEQRLDAVAERLAGTVLAELPTPVEFPLPPPERAPTPHLAGQHIAVARDAAFSFLYAANLRLLEALGAKLHFFSPLHDQRVEADAIYLPGGYPELHLPALADNQAMHQSLRVHVAAGRPLYAECGGMLYLLESLTDKDGHSARLLGLLPGHGRLQPRLAGLGMQRLTTPAGELRGHSFHHSTMETPLAPSAYGIRQRDGGRGEPVYRQRALTASYLHLYFPSAPEAAAGFFVA